MGRGAASLSCIDATALSLSVGGATDSRKEKKTHENPKKKEDCKRCIMNVRVHWSTCSYLFGERKGDKEKQKRKDFLASFMLLSLSLSSAIHPHTHTHTSSPWNISFVC